MLEKLEKLTQEQEDLIPKIRDKWLNRFFNLEFDEEKAKELITFVYEDIMKWKRPLIIVLNNPFHCQIAANMLELNAQVRAHVGAQVGAHVWEQVWEQVREQLGAQVGAQVRDQVWAEVGAHVGDQVWAEVGAHVGDQVWAEVGAQVGAEVGAQVWEQVREQLGAQVGAQVRDQVWAQVGAQVWDQVRDQVWDQVWAQVGAQVGAEVGAQVWEQVREQLGAQVGAQVRDQVGAQVWAQVWVQVWDQVRAHGGDQVRDQVWDQVKKELKLKYYDISWRCTIHDYYWCSFYDYFTKIGIINGSLFNRYKELIQCNLFSLILFENIVLVSKPPVYIHRNDKNNLHCIDGHAIEFKDGWGLYYVNGRHFTEQEFSDYIKREPSAKEIMKIDNQEKRSEVVKLWGYEKIFNELHLEELDTYEDSILYSCREFPINFVRVIDATTKKPYYLGVPRSQTKCLEAIAWTFGFSKEEYKERIES